MNLGLAAVVTSMVLAIGCAPAAGESTVAASEDAIESGDPDYHVFASHAEGAAWLSPSFTTGMFGPAAGVVPENDPRTVRVGRMLAKLWPTVRERFGVTMPTPMPLVVDSPFANAMVMYDAELGAAPNAVIVLSKLLESSDEHVEAMIAHELGHLVLKHPIPGGRDSRRYYQADAHEQPMGIHSTDRADVRGLVNLYLGASAQAGDYVVPEIADIPTAGYAYSWMSSVAFAARDTNATCARLWNQQAYLTITIRDAKRDGNTVVLSVEEKARLRRLAAEVRELAPACLAPSPAVDFPTAAAPFALPGGGTDAAVLRRSLGALGIDDSVYVGRDALVGAYGITRVMRDRVAQVMALPTFGRLRQYNAEEESDDFAMTVLHAAGLDPANMGEAVLANKPAEEQAQCRAVLATGAVPRYDLAERHHGSCYRKYHSTAFAAWLASGGEGVRADTPRRITRRAFDPAVDELVVE